MPMTSKGEITIDADKNKKIVDNKKLVLIFFLNVMSVLCVCISVYHEYNHGGQEWASEFQMIVSIWNQT